MHGVVLLAIGMEPGDGVFSIELIQLVADLPRFRVEAPEYAVEADDKIYSSEHGIEVLQHVFSRAQYVLRSGDSEYEPLIDGAEEGEAVVRVHVANRAAVIVATNFDHERIGGEAKGPKSSGIRPMADAYSRAAGSALSS